MKILSELKSVDYVFELPLVTEHQNEDEQYTNRLKTLNPDLVVLWPGNNYLRSWMNQVLNAGLKIKLVRYSSPWSSTKLLHKLGRE
jgi:hypothetical protein